MRRLFDWVKHNKLTTFLGVVVFYFLFRSTFGTFLGSNLLRSQRASTSSFEGYGGAITNPSLGAPLAGITSKSQSLAFPPVQEFAPTTDVANRLVVQETNLSLLVKDVRKTIDTMLDDVKNRGGYMVSSNITQPEEAPFATLVVRVPSEKLRDIMEYFRSLAIKVSSEYVSGYDVTDEYQDIDASLKTLEKTKARFEQIMDQAVEIDDILRIQREIINLQSQIDNLKGRQLYLEQTAKLARVTVYVSTDEIALPYTPSETFRPAVIAKLAWRSLVINLRKIATALIWITIYSIIWVPVLAIVLVVKRRRAKKPSEVNKS